MLCGETARQPTEGTVFENAVFKGEAQSNKYIKGRETLIKSKVIPLLGDNRYNGNQEESRNNFSCKIKEICK